MQIKPCVWILLVFFFGVTGCGKQDNPGEHATTDLKGKAKIATPEDWKRALNEVFTQSGKTESKDGVDTYKGCINAPPVNNASSSCHQTGITVNRDNFQKVYLFSGPINSMQRLLSTISPAHAPVSMDMYVALQDCQLPLFSGHIAIYSERGSLNMQRISILHNGKLVLDKQLDAKTRREEIAQDYLDNQERRGIREEQNFILTKEELAPLREIQGNDTTVIRVTGSNNYITVPTKSFDVVLLRENIKLYDQLLTAFENVIPPTCQ